MMYCHTNDRVEGHTDYFDMVPEVVYATLGHYKVIIHAVCYCLQCLGTECHRVYMN